MRKKHVTLLTLLVCLQLWQTAFTQTERGVCAMPGIAPPIRSSPSTLPGQEIGRGMIEQVMWAAGDACIVVNSSTGVWVYPQADLAQPPRLVASPHLLTLDEAGEIRLSSDNHLLTAPQHMALSPSGQLQALQESMDWRNLQVIALPTGQVLMQLRVEFLTTSLMLSEDDQFLIVTDTRGIARGWRITADPASEPDFQLGEARAIRNVYDMGFDANGYYPTLLVGEQLFIGQLDGSILSWNITTGEAYTPLRGHVGAVTALAHHPNGQQIASASEDGSLMLWNSSQPEPIGILQDSNTYPTPIVDLDFNQTGDYLVSGDTFGTVKLWDMQQVADTLLYDHPDLAARQVAYNANGSRIALAGDDHTVTVLDADTGNVIWRLYGHANQVTDVAFHPFNGNIISVAADGYLRVWDGLTGEPLRSMFLSEWPLRAVAVSPDGMYIAVAGWDGFVRSIEIDNQHGGYYVREVGFHDAYVGSLTFTPDSQWIASGSWDGEVNLWQRERFMRFQGTGFVHLLGAQGRINDLTVHPRGTQLVAASENGHLYFWDIAFLGESLATGVQVAETPITQIAFTPDGTSLIGTSADVWVWDAATLEEITLLRGHTNRIEGLAVHPGGRHLITTGKDATTRRFSLTNQQDIASGRHFNLPAQHLSTTSSGEIVAVHAFAGAVWVWDAATGDGLGLIQFTPPHDPPTFRLSDDGAWLAAPTIPNSLWDIRTGQNVLSTWFAPTEQVFIVDMDTDNQRLVFLQNTTLHVMDLQSGERWQTPETLQIFSPERGFTASFIPETTQVAFWKSADNYSWQNGDVFVWNWETDEVISYPMSRPQVLDGGYVISAWDDVFIDLRSGEAPFPSTQTFGLGWFSPDGRYLAAISQNRGDEVQVIEMASGVIVARYFVPVIFSDEILTVHFDTTQNRIIIADIRGGIYLWELPA